MPCEDKSTSTDDRAQDSGVAQNGGVNPTWDKSVRQDFSFTVYDRYLTGGNRCLSVKILAKNKYFHRSIGEAKIPLVGLKESPTNDITSYPLVISTGGCFGPPICQGTVSLTISVGPLVETPLFWCRKGYPPGTTSSGGSDVLPGMALGYAMG